MYDFNLQFLVEGVRGNGAAGDIAIDDITISNTRCSGMAAFGIC